MNLSRACNIALAILFAMNTVIISINWWAGEPARWHVWFAAVLLYGVLSVKCLRDAIRGVWA